MTYLLGHPCMRRSEQDGGRRGWSLGDHYRQIEREVEDVLLGEWQFRITTVNRIFMPGTCTLDPKCYSLLPNVRDNGADR